MGFNNQPLWGGSQLYRTCYWFAFWEFRRCSYGRCTFHVVEYSRNPKRAREHCQQAWKCFWGAAWGQTLHASKEKLCTPAIPGWFWRMGKTLVWLFEWFHELNLGVKRWRHGLDGVKLRSRQTSMIKLLRTNFGPGLDSMWSTRWENRSQIFPQSGYKTFGLPSEPRSFQGLVRSF